MAALALLELLDRDGTARHSLSVSSWPVHVGRALDNDLVLDDPHTAAHHFSIEADDSGLFVQVGNSINGLRLGERQLAAGQRHALGSGPVQLAAGRTLLRLRQAASELPPELPLQPVRTHLPARKVLSTLLLLVAVAFMFVFETYLEADPALLVRELGGMALVVVGTAMSWCGLWTLMSKVFTHQMPFLWHVRVLLCATFAWKLFSVCAMLLAFALSWPWLSDFSFVATCGIAGAALYFHLLAVEPHRPRQMRTVAVAMAVTAAALNLWFNWQGSERFGNELYMSHLFPPALRLASPSDVDTFMQRLAPLQAELDEKAAAQADDGQ
jgi:hypothetical protein